MPAYDQGAHQTRHILCHHPLPTPFAIELRLISSIDSGVDGSGLSLLMNTFLDFGGYYITSGGTGMEMELTHAVQGCPGKLSIAPNPLAEGVGQRPVAEPTALFEMGRVSEATTYAYIRGGNRGTRPISGPLRRWCRRSAARPRPSPLATTPQQRDHCQSDRELWREKIPPCRWARRPGRFEREFR